MSCRCLKREGGSGCVCMCGRAGGRPPIVVHWVTAYNLFFLFFFPFFLPCLSLFLYIDVRHTIYRHISIYIYRLYRHTHTLPRVLKMGGNFLFCFGGFWQPTLRGGRNCGTSLWDKQEDRYLRFFFYIFFLFVIAIFDILIFTFSHLAIKVVV